MQGRRRGHARQLRPQGQVRSPDELLAAGGPQGQEERREVAEEDLLDLHTYIHTYIHTFIHTYIHTYIHYYIQTYKTYHIMLYCIIPYHIVSYHIISYSTSAGARGEVGSSSSSGATSPANASAGLSSMLDSNIDVNNR